jgi:predicted ATPase
MLTAFSARNYRNVTTDELRFKRVNILIGPNNSGKSNLIRALALPRDLLRGADDTRSAFLRTIESHGAADIIDRRSAPRGEVSLRYVVQPQGEAPIEYKIDFRVGSALEFPAAFYITREILAWGDEPTGTPQSSRGWVLCEAHGKTKGAGSFQSRETGGTGGRVSRKSFPIDPKETVVHQWRSLIADKRFYDAFYPSFDRWTRAFRSAFEGLRVYAGSELRPRTIADGAPLDLAVRQLDPAGAQLGNVLRHVDQTHDLSEYALRLRELDRRVQRVKIVDVSESRRDVELVLDGGSFRLRDLSDGTLKAMALASLLWSPERVGTLVIDEPELNLHPAWLKVVAGWILDHRSADQVFVSTHSPDLLDGFTEAFRAGELALFVCGGEGQGIRAAEPRALDSFFQRRWELGDLYRVGEPALGGWPW